MPLTPAERAEIIDIARCEAMSQTAELLFGVQETRRRRLRRAGIVSGAAIGALLIGGLAWSQMAPRYTPRPETRATGKCADGTWTYAYNRQGACSGHGGVKVFYK